MKYDYKLGLGLAFLAQNDSYVRLLASRIKSAEKLGGEDHYMKYGRFENRTWALSADTDAANSQLLIHKSLLSNWRSLIYLLKYIAFIL